MAETTTTCDASTVTAAAMPRLAASEWLLTNGLGGFAMGTAMGAAITASIQRQKPLRHILFASGVPGVGKTSLARLTAHLLGVGFVELGGQIKDTEAYTKVDVSSVQAVVDDDHPRGKRSMGHA